MNEQLWTSNKLEPIGLENYSYSVFKHANSAPTEDRVPIVERASSRAEALDAYGSDISEDHHAIVEVWNDIEDRIIAEYSIVAFATFNGREVTKADWRNK